MEVSAFVDTHGSVLSKLRKPPEMHAAIVPVGGTADTKRHLCNADKESASVKAVPGAVVAGLSFDTTFPRADTCRRYLRDLAVAALHSGISVAIR